MSRGDRQLSITIVATSEKAQRELEKMGDAADKLGLRVAAASEHIAKSGEHTEEFGSKTQKAFESVQAAADSVGADLGPVGDIIEHVSVSMEGAGESSGRMARGLKVASGAMAALGAVVSVEAAKDEKAFAQLETAVQNSGHAWKDYAEELETSARSQAKNGHSAADAAGALTTLTAALKDPKKAMDEMGLAADIAARKGITLGEAAAKVAAVHLGSAKALKGFGIDAKELVNTDKLLSEAHHEVAESAAHLGRATAALGDFEERMQAQRIAGQQKHAAAVDAAQARLSQADQHLADVTTANAARRKDAQTNADQAVVSSSQTLAAARKRLADVEQQLHEKTQLSLSDTFQLRDAQQSLADVQERIADGQLQGADATQALRDAQQRLTDTQALQAEKTKVTAKDQDGLALAARAVTDATNAHTAAQAKARTAGAETTAEARQQRDALAAQARAKADLAKAEASSAGGLTVAQLQTERKLRADVAKATAEQLKGQKDLAAAQQAERENGSKIQVYLDRIRKQFEGSADAQNHTLDGMLHTFLAYSENSLASLGPYIGLALLGVSAAVQLAGTAIGGAILGTIGSIATGALALIGEFVTGVILAALPIEIGLAPIIAIIVAIGAAVYLLWRNWDAVWGFIQNTVSGAFHFIKQHMDWIVALAFGPLGVAVNLLRKHWDDVWDGIKATASGVKDFFVTVFGGIAEVVLAPMRLVITVINSIIDAIDSIKFDFRAPSWAGGFGWKFDGFGIDHLPSFATGGVVPGAKGSKQLVVAHGGETVFNEDQNRALAGMLGHGTGGGLPPIHVHLDGAVITDDATARRLGWLVADGVHERLVQKQNNGEDLQLSGRR